MKKQLVLLILFTSILFAGSLTFQPLEQNEDSQSYRFYMNNKPVAEVNVNASGWVTYVHGRIPDGKALYTNEKGVKLAVWPIHAGVASGVYQEYSEDGDVVKIINYQAGQRQGVYKEFWDDGTPHIVATYSKGRLEGRYKEFDEEGKLIHEYDYVNGAVRQNSHFVKSLYKEENE